jgi:DNA-binding XRE family transcriptional regulator
MYFNCIGHTTIFLQDSDQVSHFDTNNTLNRIQKSSLDTLKGIRYSSVSGKIHGELRLQHKTYIVVPTEEFRDIELEKFRRAMGIPDLDVIWVGYLIRQHRMRLGLTQAELGSRTDSDQKHIDKIENGTIKCPKDPLLRKFIFIFGEDFHLGLSLLGIAIVETDQ